MSISASPNSCAISARSYAPSAVDSSEASPSMSSRRCYRFSSSDYAPKSFFTRPYSNLCPLLCRLISASSNTVTFRVNKSCYRRSVCRVKGSNSCPSGVPCSQCFMTGECTQSARSSTRIQTLA
jgi:hypothetical protein